MDWFYTKVETADNSLSEEDKIKVMDEVLSLDSDNESSESESVSSIRSDMSNLDNIKVAIDNLADDLANIKIHMKCMESISMIKYKKLESINTYSKFMIVMLVGTNMLSILSAVLLLR
jgi:hypothetical protein